PWSRVCQSPISDAEVGKPRSARAPWGQLPMDLTGSGTAVWRVLVHVVPQPVDGLLHMQVHRLAGRLRIPVGQRSDYRMVVVDTEGSHRRDRTGAASVDCQRGGQR